jgi:hypothetical protein
MSEIIILIVLLSLGYYFGQRAEKKHYISIIERENQLINLPLVTLKTPPPLAKAVDDEKAAQAQLKWLLTALL